MNDKTNQDQTEAKPEGGTPEILPAVRRRLRLQKIYDILYQIENLDRELDKLDEVLNEIKTTGGCGNISLCRHSNKFESNTKQIIALDYKNEDKHIIQYFIDKINRDRDIVLTKIFNYEKILTKLEEITDANDA